MGAITPEQRWQQALHLLKQKEKKQAEELKASAEKLARSLSPAGLLSAAIRSISETPDIRAGLIDTAIGIGAGWLGRKLVTGNNKNVFLKITGSVLQFVLSGFVSRKMHQARKETGAG